MERERAREQERKIEKDRVWVVNRLFYILFLYAESGSVVIYHFHIVFDVWEQKHC